MSVILQIIVAVLVFGFLIFIHELGHFTVGKLSNMRVNEFSLGMGPVVWSRQKGETQYSLRALPIGGFVSVEGEDNGEESFDPRAYNNMPIGKRIAFVFAGAFMNLALGFVLLSVLVGMRASIPTTTVGGFHEGAQSSVALHEGDEILSVNGMRVFTPNDISFSMVSDKDGVIDFTVRRDGAVMRLDGVDFGMQTIENGSRVIKLDFYVLSVPKTFGNAVQYTGQWMISIVRQVWASFVNLVTGNFQLSELSGPVGVSTAIGKASFAGLTTFLTLVSFITVNIGVFNLLPLPALDGGRLFFLFIELIFRRPISRKYEGAIHAVGLILLMGLMLFVTFQDVLRMF